MKMVFALAGCLLLAAPAVAAPVCISTHDIANSKPEGHGASLLFSMRDGSQYRATLKNQCPGLDFNGFAWTVRDPGERVCENGQSLRVLNSGEVCLVGKIEKLSRAPKPG
jgi:hypothetical protein